MAFESPRYTVMQNVAGTVEVLEAVRRAGGVSKVLFAGSGNELGRPRYLPMDEEHPLTPQRRRGSWPCGPGTGLTGFPRWCCPPAWSSGPACGGRCSSSSGFEMPFAESPSWWRAAGRPGTWPSCAGTPPEAASLSSTLVTVPRRRGSGRHSALTRRARSWATAPELPPPRPSA